MIVCLCVFISHMHLCHVYLFVSRVVVLVLSVCVCVCSCHVCVSRVCEFVCVRVLLSHAYGFVRMKHACLFDTWVFVSHA